MAARCAALLGAALAVLYATLPWWTPKALVARKLSSRLSSELGVPVRIGRLRMSWAEGVELSDVRVDSPSAFGGGPMVTVGRLRSELAPLTMLFGGQVEWAELSDVVVRAVVDGDGQVNLAALRPLMEMAPPGHVGVRRAAVSLRLPAHERLLRLDVTDLRYAAGRLRNVGRVTMSAALVQEGRRAPVTLLASAGADGALASCSFRFNAVDISQLALPSLLGLPLKRLRGRGSGQLDCRISEEGVVDEFRFSLVARDLDAQPAGGPALPVIDRAELTVHAVYDWYTRAVEMDRFRLRVPGIDLAGSGRVHAEVLTGGWMGARTLELTGTVNPSTVAALLGREPAPLPGDLRIDGDVTLRVSLRGEPTQLGFNVVLDASQAPLTAGSRLAKPPGRTLSAELRGSVQRRTWQFTLDQTELRVGGNRFVGRGAMQNMRGALKKWIAAGDAPTLTMVLADLAGLNWQGSWHIVELTSLRELLGLGPLEGVRLSGTIEGDWSVEHADTARVRGSLRLAEDAELQIGRWFVKPRGRPLHAEMTGEVASRPPSVSNVRLWCTVGSASLGVERGRVALSVGEGPPPAAMGVSAEGRYTLRGLRELLGCVPALRPAVGRLSGAVAGRFRARLAGPRRRVHLVADATQLAVDAGEAFAKSPGHPAELVCDFQTDPALPAARRNRLSVRAGLGSATADGWVEFPPARNRPRTLRCAGRLRVTEAAWLLERAPALAKRLAGLDVRGAMEAAVEARLQADAWSGRITCDADDLQFRLPALAGFKPRGAALRLRLAARGGGGPAEVDLAADVGRSSLAATGTVALADEPKAPPPGAYWPPPGVAGVDLRLRGRVVPDRALASLAPDLAARLARWGAEGAVRADLRVTGDAGGLAVRGSVDAGGLALSVPGTLRKRAGERAVLTLEAAVPPDLARLTIDDCLLRTDAGQVRASVTAPLLRDGRLRGRVAVNVPDLAALSPTLPRLGRYRPGGAVFAEAVVTRAPGRELIRSVALTARDAAATVRGKACRLDGDLRVENVTPSAAGWSVGRIRADSLEWRVGGSHGFLVADLQEVTADPAGRFELVCTDLDLHELGTWLAPPTASGTGKLDDDARQALARRAERAIADLNERLDEAAVRGRVKAARLRYYDPAVRAFYDLRHLVADVSAHRGRLRASLRCGINGGQVRQRYAVDLSDTDPRVALSSDIRDVLASQNIQLLLSRDFPGNTVYGSFSRAQDVTYSLKGFVMNALDARYRPIAVGEGTTVTRDGLLQGRAAPKFITGIFPGLNLAKYRYRVMYAFAEYLPDGTERNDMLFSGATYDIYIEGTTDRDRIGRYHTGVLLLPAVTSPKALHELRQGRIPIFNFKARIEGGRFHDEEVRYPLPTETAYTIFLKNNLLYRLWLTARQRRGATVIAPEPGDEEGPSER